MEHLAIMDLETILMILDGFKVIESRFSKNNISPYKRVKIGDVVYLKVSGGEVLATFEVADVLYFDNLNEAKITDLKNKYNDKVKAPGSYWEYKKDCSYGTFIYIKNPKKIEPFPIYKKGRQAFVTVSKVMEDFPLIKNDIKSGTFDCKNNLHLFDMDLKCSNCGYDNVDKNILFGFGKYDLILNELKKSKWNYDWMNAIVDNVAMKNIEKDNDIFVIKKVLSKSIGKYDEKKDGSQTSSSGSVINYARHVTGTCCRNCLLKWYSIPKEHILNGDELDYFSGLIKYYIDNYIVR